MFEIFKYLFSIVELVELIQWIWNSLFLVVAGYTISNSDRLPNFLSKFMLIAVPLYKLLIEWHFILEYIPVLVLMDHAFVMFA